MWSFLLDCESIYIWGQDSDQKVYLQLWYYWSKTGIDENVGDAMLRNTMDQTLELVKSVTRTRNSSACLHILPAFNPCAQWNGKNKINFLNGNAFYISWKALYVLFRIFFHLFKLSASKVASFHQLGDQNFIFILLFLFQRKRMISLSKLCQTNCHHFFLSSLVGETY